MDGGTFTGGVHIDETPQLPQAFMARADIATKHEAEIGRIMRKDAKASGHRGKLPVSEKRDGNRTVRNRARDVWRATSKEGWLSIKTIAVTAKVNRDFTKIEVLRLRDAGILEERPASNRLTMEYRRDASHGVNPTDAQRVVLEALGDDWATNFEISKRIGVTKATVSKHTIKLRAAKMIESRPRRTGSGNQKEHRRIGSTAHKAPKSCQADADRRVTKGEGA